MQKEDFGSIRVNAWLGPPCLTKSQLDRPPHCQNRDSITDLITLQVPGVVLTPLQIALKVITVNSESLEDS